MIISKEFRFEAAHILPRHPGKCSRLHGHSWVLVVAIEGPIDPETGFVMDFADLKDKVQPLIDFVDHAYLGAEHYEYNMGVPLTGVFGTSFYPSSENLLVKFAEILAPQFEIKFGDNPPIQKLFELRLKETCTSEAILRAPFWKGN